MPTLPSPRRRFAGVSLLALLAVLGVLYLLRRIPPSGRGGEEAAPEQLTPVPAGKSAAAGGGRRTSSSVPVQRESASLAAEAARLIQMPEGDARLEALGILLDSWAVVDPQAAGTWIAGLPAGNFRTDAAGELLDRWASADGPAAWRWLSSSGTVNEEMTGRLGEAWARTGGAAASSWAAGLTDPALRVAAISATASSWAAGEPAAAATWVETLPPEDRTAAAVSVVNAWAATDGPAAGAWLLRLAGENLDSIAAPAAALARQWAEADAGAVSRWLNGLPAGPAREATATVFAVTAAPLAPGDALLWAQSLAAPEDRASTVVDVCEQWLDAAPEEFRAGIEEQLQNITEPEVRKAVYAMLFEKDPAFKETLLEMVEESTTAAATPEPAAPPEEPVAPGAEVAPLPEPELPSVSQ